MLPESESYADAMTVIPEFGLLPGPPPSRVSVTLTLSCSPNGLPFFAYAQMKRCLPAVSGIGLNRYSFAISRIPMLQGLARTHVLTLLRIAVPVSFPNTCHIFHYSPYSFSTSGSCLAFPVTYYSRIAVLNPKRKVTTGNISLSNYNHFFCSAIIASFDAIKINSAVHLLTELIFPIPMC